MSQREFRESIHATCGWVLLGTLLLAGCGGSGGPEVYHVSGTVTFAGRPVPGGTVLFVPDASRANRGPSGYAAIRDGKFDTRDGGKGTIGGPHQVRITGEESLGTQAAPGSEAPTTRSLFPEYVTDVDFPKESTTHEFSVPESMPRQ